MNLGNFDDHILLACICPNSQLYGAVWCLLWAVKRWWVSWLGHDHQLKVMKTTKLKNMHAYHGSAQNKMLSLGIQNTYVYAICLQNKSGNVSRGNNKTESWMSCWSRNRIYVWCFHAEYRFYYSDIITSERFSDIRKLIFWYTIRGDLGRFYGISKSILDVRKWFYNIMLISHIRKSLRTSMTKIYIFWFQIFIYDIGKPISGVKNNFIKWS